MEAEEKLDAYFRNSGPFRDQMNQLRKIALKCGLEETLKWNAPVYAKEGKNILGIMTFKKHCGLWFFNGVFLSDPLGILQNAQEGKTRAMRHWKFKTGDPIPSDTVKAYIDEALVIAEKGLKVAAKKPSKKDIPPELNAVLLADPVLSAAFLDLAPYKQNDFCEYISSAKQAETRERRLQKIIPMISKGIGMNDKYRK